MAIRIGVIGTADIARRRMIPAILQNKEFEYVGVAIADYNEWGEHYSEVDYKEILNQKKIKANSFCDEFGGKTYIGYETLLKDTSIDAVYIPLPPALHYKWGKLALSYNKHVLMEKPFTINLNEANELLEIAKENELTVTENYGFIYHNQFNKLKELFINKTIGNLREIRATFGFPHRDNSDFRYNKQMGGGALLDCGGYVIKAANQFLNNPKLAFSNLTQPDNYEVDVYGSAIIKDNSITAYVSFGMDNSYKCDFELWGSEGSLLSTRAYTAPENFESFIILSNKDGQKRIDCGQDNQFLKILSIFSYAIKNTKKRNDLYDDISKQQIILNEIINNN